MGVPGQTHRGNRHGRPALDVQVCLCVCVCVCLGFGMMVQKHAIVLVGEGGACVHAHMV